MIRQIVALMSEILTLYRSNGSRAQPLSGTFKSGGGFSFKDLYFSCISIILINFPILKFNFRYCQMT